MIENRVPGRPIVHGFPDPTRSGSNIEILRFLEHGERVACVKVDPGSIGVDTPEDVRQVEKILVDIKETKL